VTVLDAEGKELRKATVLVNGPLRAGRYMLFQSSFDPRTETTSVLEVVYDPGVTLVFIGFLLLPVGIAFVFYIQPVLRRRARTHV
jgi:hypothetical protein